LAIEHAQLVLSRWSSPRDQRTLGVLVYRNDLLAGTVLNVTGVFVTIPSFATVRALNPDTGIGAPPVILALVMYALLPMVRNTIVGLRSVDSAITESAQAWG
jgi:osmoprotectant transport system permease protein